MVTILVDEAYAFDYLAILEIKYEYSKKQSILDKVLECRKHIEDQLGSSFFKEIVSSSEYQEVIKANKETFAWVDKAKTDSCKASDVDKSNYERCKARNALQEKFFSNKISEVKFGYDRYKQQ